MKTASPRTWRHLPSDSFEYGTLLSYLATRGEQGRTEARVRTAGCPSPTAKLHDAAHPTTRRPKGRHRCPRDSPPSAAQALQQNGSGTHRTLEACPGTLRVHQEPLRCSPLHLEADPGPTPVDPHPVWHTLGAPLAHPSQDSLAGECHQARADRSLRSPGRTQGVPLHHGQPPQDPREARPGQGRQGPGLHSLSARAWTPWA